MPYSARMQSNLLYSVFLSPRGNVRMADLGMQIAQQYLSPFDRLIGIIGEAGSGKSMLVKGMFPGVELSNNDEGVNIRPLPLLNLNDEGFYSPHTYHVDMRFETAFTQPHVLARAVLEAINRGKRVIVEHFDMLYPLLDRNAHLLIGVGEEIIITRPNLFGPEPKDLAKIVFASIKYRKMIHTAEDLCEYVALGGYKGKVFRGDVRHGFIRAYDQRPPFDPKELERRVREVIGQDLPVSYLDETHIAIGERVQKCNGPRMHVKSTGEIENFTLLADFPVDPLSGQYMLVGHVGREENTWDFNRFYIE